MSEIEPPLVYTKPKTRYLFLPDNISLGSPLLQCNIRILNTLLLERHPQVHYCQQFFVPFDHFFCDNNPFHVPYSLSSINVMKISKYFWTIQIHN
jgi:hypothetical protein